MTTHESVSPKWALPIRCGQLVISILMMSLSAYTLSDDTDWKHVQYTVGASAVIVLFTLALIAISVMDGPASRLLIILVLDFISFDLLLAVWISLSVDLGKRKQCVDDDGDGGLAYTTSCKTIYGALGFAAADWLLFAATFFNDIRASLSRRRTLPENAEKNEATA